MLTLPEASARRSNVVKQLCDRRAATATNRVAFGARTTEYHTKMLQMRAGRGKVVCRNRSVSTHSARNFGRPVAVFEGSEVALVPKATMT